MYPLQNGHNQFLQGIGYVDSLHHSLLKKSRGLEGGKEQWNNLLFSFL